MTRNSLHIGFIVHGKPDRVRRFQRELHKNTESLTNLPYEVIYTKPGTADIIARNMAEQGVSHIIAVGGDGTLSEVVDGIMRTENREVIVGHMPAGTANDWMKTWPAADSMQSLLTLVSSQHYQQVDIGCLTFSNSQKRHFLNIADTGIGAAVVRRVHFAPAWLGANLRFFLSILRTFISYRNIDVRCKSDGFSWSGKAKAVIAANGKYFGSGLAIAPEANPQDGLLDVIIVGDVSLLDYLRYLPALKKGRKIDDDRVIYQKATNIELITSMDCGVEADGELLLSGPVRVEIKPGMLRFLPPFQK